MHPNVFMIIEAAHRMGLNFTPSDDIVGWVRVHKKILAAEQEELDRRIQNEVDKLQDLVPSDKLEEFKYRAKSACRLPHNWVRPWRKDREAEATERSEEHTSELQSRFDLVCRHLLEKKA